MALFYWGSQLLPSLQWLEAVLPACFRACLNSRVFIRTQRAFRCFWIVNYLSQWLTKYMVLRDLLLENIYKSVSVLFGHLHLSNTVRFELSKSRELLPDHGLENVHSNLKEKRFCIWRSTKNDGWSQPVWDRFDWDHAKVECLSLEQTGVILDLAETLLSLSFSWWKNSPEASEISSLAHLMVPHECDSKSKRQRDFVISEQKNKTTF